MRIAQLFELQLQLSRGHIGRYGKGLSCSHSQNLAMHSSVSADAAHSHAISCLCITDTDECAAVLMHAATTSASSLYKPTAAEQQQS